MDLSTNIADSVRDIPFGKIVGGRADNSLAALSPEVVQAYKNVNDSAWGTHIYWDDRGHVFTGGSYWSDSERLTSMALTSHCRNCSFPAFFNDDQDFDLPGRQPILGTGTGDGDTWGTWGGYYTWDPEEITDSPSLWKSEVSLVASSEYSNDIPAFDSSTADLAIRKPQQFKPAEGSTVYWAMTRLSDGKVMQSGQETVGTDGLVIIPGINIYKYKCEIAISPDPAVFVREDHSGSPAPLPALKIFPNPAGSSMTIQCYTAQSGSLSLLVYNLAGQEIAVLVDDYKHAGTHTYTWSAEGLEPGMYICKFKSGNKVHVAKILCN